MTQEFVTLPRSVVEQVLDALEGCRVEYNYNGKPVDASDQDVINARTVLRAALEQPQVEQEPFVWLDTNFGDVWEKDAIALYGKPAGAIPLYTHPQPAQKPLTDDQVLKAVRHLYQSDLPVGMGFSDDLDVARAIEAAHNIK